MPWVKLDDGFARHAKLLAAGAEGVALDVAAMCWSSEKGTDGFVPDYAISVLYPVRNPRGVASRLAQVGRWERDDERGGWMIHDYLVYNPTAAEVAELKAARSDAGQRGGQNSQRRQASARASGQASASPNGQDSEALAGASCEPPIPSSSKSKPLLPAGSELFEPWWQVFPKRKGRKIGKADAERVWRRLKPDEISACLVAVNHYAKACNAGQTLAMDAHRWLSKRRWVDWQEPAKAEATTYAPSGTVYT